MAKKVPPAQRPASKRVKSVADKKYGEVLGLHIIGPNASDLIPEGVRALALGFFQFVAERRSRWFGTHSVEEQGLSP